ncbi:membrane protein insertion efficiency factor YidD [Candidatus Babeliales bacterium]|nr:membrane protein insertion efficiency factor YidD [Candidatus Babeliales bacterium]
MNLSKPKKLFLDFIWSFYQAARPLLGLRNVCIYPISCSHYAKHMLEHKVFYIAIPLIILRILSCNPITALIRKRLY